uniref:Macoilin n=1 Tax=Setaria digitata TaxID=48799 RepID=A0A915Q572_9BILA
MMKRTTRTIDMPKLRRNLKGRGRIAETVCCGHFSGFVYVKFVLLWLSCIALDLLIGFRFELLYPVWLLMRNCYDSFRFQGLVSSLQYSAFSAFFVCATVTTDLICFVFLPVQLLFFLASTYVWILLVWQTAERGIGSAHLLLWIAIISFEYNWRYRGDSPLQLLKGSTFGSTLNFLTGGLLANWLELRNLPTTSGVAESDSSKECYSPSRFVNPIGGFLGGFGVSLMGAFTHSSSFTSDLCRPFAAHCIGYPVVMLGFGLKTYFRLWRVRRRQREVSRANEVYCKLLVEALPSLYEGQKIYPRCNGTILQDHEHIEYESEICPASLQNLAICASPSSSTITQRKNSRSGAGWKQNSWKQTGINSKKISAASSGSSSTRKERIVRENNDDDDTASSVSLSVTPRMYLWRVIWDLLWNIVLYILGGVVDSSSSLLDDRISLSSNEVESDDEMMEQEETSSQPDDASPSSNRLTSIHRHPGSAKKSKVLIPNSGSYSRAKGGRSRGRHLQNHTGYILSPLTPGGALSSSTLGANCALNNNLLNLAAGSIQQDRQMYTSAGSATYQNISISNGDIVENDSPSAGITFCGKASADSSQKSEPIISSWSTEEMLETLRNDLRAARSQENELRCMLQQYINTEKHLKGELQQLKLKQEQSDSKLANVMKAREQDKSAMQLLEKRLMDAQTKKNELERELNAEKRSKIKEEHAAARALAAAQSNKSFECSEACKTRKADLEKELRAVRRELKAKEELANEYEEELQQLRQYKESNDLQKMIIVLYIFEELRVALRVIREKNTHLEKSLSAENRLKQKLFYALNEARGQMADFQQQLFARDADLRLKDVELMNLRERIGNGTDDSTKLSPTGDNRGSLAVKTCCGPAGGTILPPVVTDIGSVLKSHVTTEQEIFSATLSSAANSAYMPYTFSTHPSQDDHSLFDSSTTRSASTIPPNSVSPPPASRLSSISSDAFRFTNSKFSPTSANNNCSGEKVRHIPVGVFQLGITVIVVEAKFCFQLGTPHNLKTNCIRFEWRSASLSVQLDLFSLRVIFFGSLKRKRATIF